MGELAGRDDAAYKNAKMHVLKLISYYVKHHNKRLFESFEKNHIYTEALKTAYEEVSRSSDAPLNVLDALLIKFDSWAHTGLDNDYVFSVSASAIEDIIDLVLAS